MECSHPDSVRTLRRGQHACLLYEDADEALTTVAHFVAAGAGAGERCIYVVGEHAPERVAQSLAAAGVDVAREVARGALVLVSRWEVSFPDGEFDPAAMIAFVRQGIVQALVDGFTGVRVVAEMTWALQMGVGANKLIHYEALGNHLYPDEPLVAVCMYDRRRFPAAVCLDAMRVHPWVAVGTTAYDNLYYESPDAVIDGSAAGARVEWMLGQLERVRAAEAQRLELLSARAARAEAEAAARRKDALLAMLAHELRTPLTSMLASTQAALRKLDREPSADPAHLRRSLELVARQAAKQARLIEQVLDAARLAEGQLAPEPVHADLAALVREVGELMRTVAPEHTLVVCASGSAELRMDPLRVEQVLVNLLDNARKYSPAGSRIEVDLVVAPDAFQVTVRDHGPGIPAGEHERIFERFYRLHGDGQGVGLGLHISRELLRRQGGELHVESPADGGTRFVMHLPRHTDVTAATGGRIG